TIEFIVTFVFIIGFTFAFFRIALIYTNGYLVHYATYMASRAYMVFDNNSNQPTGGDGDASRLAKRVFEGFKLGGLINGFTGQLQINDPQSFNRHSNNLYVGTWVDFKQKLPTPSFAAGKDLNLRSESFLGREPTRSECYERICNAMGEAALQEEYCGIHSTLFDNGC
ncbi:MAG: hypothetical protein OXB92_17145, partial [Acidimicrobiaceae bacterium]|nr:hypothetical protein [Acidimicrobiaceae bacterium]